MNICLLIIRLAKWFLLNKFNSPPQMERNPTSQKVHLFVIIYHLISAVIPPPIVPKPPKKKGNKVSE